MGEVEHRGGYLLLKSYERWEGITLPFPPSLGPISSGSIFLDKSPKIPFPNHFDVNRSMTGPLIFHRASNPSSLDS